MFEVLYKADMYLLPGLKKQCGLYIGDLIDEENIFTVLEVSRLFDLPKLEDRCAEFMATHIEQVTSPAYIGYITGAGNISNIRWRLFSMYRYIDMYVVHLSKTVKCFESLIKGVTYPKIMVTLHIFYIYKVI